MSGGSFPLSGSPVSHASQHARQLTPSQWAGMMGGHGAEMMSAISPAVASGALSSSSPVMLRLPVLLHRVVHGVEVVQLPEQPLILPLHRLPRVARQLAHLPVDVDRHAEHVAVDRAVVLRALAEKRRPELVELLQPMRRDALCLVLEAVEQLAAVLDVS